MPTGPAAIMTWGKHKGSTFQQAFEDQDYLTWCVAHLVKEKLVGNRLAWYEFMEDQIQPAEEKEASQEDEDPATTRFRATPRPRPAAEEMSNENAERLEAVEAQVGAIEQRLGAMETMLSEIVLAMRQQR